MLNPACDMILFVLFYAGCGATFGNHSGIITSPGYPNDYENNERCGYLLLASEGGLLTLQSLEFTVESGYDYVNVSK